MLGCVYFVSSCPRLLRCSESRYFKSLPPPTSAIQDFFFVRRFVKHCFYFVELAIFGNVFWAQIRSFWKKMWRHLLPFTFFAECASEFQCLDVDGVSCDHLKNSCESFEVPFKGDYLPPPTVTPPPAGKIFVIEFLALLWV